MDKFNIPGEKLNVMGGSTAIGHPLGSTMVSKISTPNLYLNSLD